MVYRDCSLTNCNLSKSYLWQQIVSFCYQHDMLHDTCDLTTTTRTSQYGHGCRLAGTIVTEQSRYLTFVHVQTNVFHRNFLTRSRTKLLHKCRPATCTTHCNYISATKASIIIQSHSLLERTQVFGFIDQLFSGEQHFPPNPRKPVVSP